MAIDRNSTLSDLRQLHRQMKTAEGAHDNKQHLRGEHNWTCKDSLYFRSNQKVSRLFREVTHEHNKATGKDNPKNREAKFERSVSIITDILKNSLPEEVAKSVLGTVLTSAQVVGKHAIDTDSLGKIIEQAEKKIDDLEGAPHNGPQNDFDADGIAVFDKQPVEPVVVDDLMSNVSDANNDPVEEAHEDDDGAADILHNNNNENGGNAANKPEMNAKDDPIDNEVVDDEVIGDDESNAAGALGNTAGEVADDEESDAVRV